MLELRSPSKLFIDRAKEWHRDEDLNHWTGFGRGMAGQQLAEAAMERVLDNDPLKTNMVFRAVWDDAVPVGYVAFSDLDRQNKTADLHITLAPEQHNKGYGPEVLIAAVDLGFADGLYRIQFRPMSSNKRAIKAGFKAGFKLEARTKYSVWTIDGPQDQAQMRAVLPEWRKRVSKSS